MVILVVSAVTPGDEKSEKWAQKMARSLQIHRDSDRQAIQAMLDSAYGKIERVLTVDDLRDAAKQRFSLRLMDGAMMRIEAPENLPKAYRYKKEIGVAIMRHDGKRWVFVSASRGVCWAGSSTGGSHTTYPDTHRIEITQTLIDRAALSFRAQDQVDRVAIEKAPC